MKELEQIVFSKLENHPNRINHTKGVIAVSEILAIRYHENVLDAKIAALFHDYTKYEELSFHESVLAPEIILKYQDLTFMYHPYSAAEELKKIKPDISNKVLDAIKYHVWLRPGATVLEKIIFIADKSEPSRTFGDAKIIYELAEKDLDEAVLYALESGIKHTKESGYQPSQEQIESYLYYKNKKESIWLSTKM